MIIDRVPLVSRARTFMRAVVAEETKVGLLLFDEPSASLDPVAEHGEAVIAHRSYWSLLTFPLD